jgi:phosphoribosylformimino-5-aminoimidazole carboxamide ribotide isomerase
MLIPSIDLMGGKIVQLVQGERKALEFDDFSTWIARFSDFPLVQLIDLDAAMGKGSNRELIRDFCAKLPCQIGGGIRSAADARAALDWGAKKIIVGSSLITFCGQSGPTSGPVAVNLAFAQELSESIGPEQLVFAVDSRGGRVAIHGWKTITDIAPAAMMRQLEPFCSAFLYTHIDTEGLMRGIPLNIVAELRERTSRRLIVAGGISSQETIETLHSMGVDAVVGMAIYSGLLNIPAP